MTSFFNQTHDPTKNVEKLLNFDRLNTYVSYVGWKTNLKQTQGLQIRCANAEIKREAERTEFVCERAGGVCVCTPSEPSVGASRIRNIHLLDRLCFPSSLIAASPAFSSCNLYHGKIFCLLDIVFSLPCWKLMKNFSTLEILAFSRSFHCRCFSFVWLIRFSMLPKRLWKYFLGTRLHCK